MAVIFVYNKNIVYVKVVASYMFESHWCNNS